MKKTGISLCFLYVYGVDFILMIVVMIYGSPVSYIAFHVQNGENSRGITVVLIPRIYVYDDSTTKCLCRKECLEEMSNELTECNKSIAANGKS